MVNNIGYHATTSQIALKMEEDFLRRKLKINSGIMFLNAQERQGNRRKNPGSLGYGLYIFVDGILPATELIEFYSSRVLKSGKSVLEISIEISDEDILDLTDHSSNDYITFIEYLKEASHSKIIKNHVDNFKNTRYQNVWNGIAVEMFIYELSKKGIHAKAVIGDTYTPNEDTINGMTFPNGHELVIRKTDIIQTISVL